MATKTAAKKVGKKTTIPVETKVLTISAKDMLAGLERFGHVCSFVESQMNAPASPASVNEIQGSSIPVKPQIPEGQYGAEQKALVVRGCAAQTNAAASELRDRICYGSLSKGQGIQGEANSAVKPSEGPIKDALDGTLTYLDGITLCLEQIANYIGQ